MAAGGIASSSGQPHNQADAGKAQRLRAAAPPRQSESALRSLLSVSSGVIFHMSADWAVMTQLYCRGALVVAGERNRTWLLKHIPKDERPRVSAAIERAVREKSAFDLEHRVLRSGAGEGWAHSVAVPVLGESGETLEWIGTSSDVSERKRQEAALRESEAKYQALVKYAPVGIYEVDFHTKRLTSVNEAMCILSGYSREELLELDPYSLLDEPGRARALARLSQWMNGEAPGQYVEYRIIAKDGHTLDALMNIRYTRDENGEPKGATAFGYDITERKRAEEALQKSEEKYRELVKCAPAGIYEIDFRKNRFTSVNDVMCEWTGFSREEFLSMSPTDMLSGDSLAELQAKARMWTSGNEPDPMMEFKAYAKDGREIYALLHANFKRDESGRPAGVTIIAHNTTERRRAEEALRESERKYHELVQQAPVGIYEMDFRTRRFLSVNDVMCRILGYSREEFLRMSPADIMDEESRAKFQRRVCQLLSGTEPERNLEYRVFAKDGGEIVAELSATFTKDENGKPRGATVVAHDITERKRTEEALRTSEARLAELSRNLAAEVNALRIFHRINTRFIEQTEIESIYRDILDAAMSLTDADGGTLHLAADEGKALEIAIHAGLGRALMRCFTSVAGGMVSFSAAPVDKARVIVDDVLECAEPENDTVRQAMLEDGIRCVQSTPMFSLAGNFMGLFSTYYKTPHSFSDRELSVFDLLARQAADVIELVKTEKALREREEQSCLLAEALEKKNKLVTDFFINISHEFKTPLSILMLGVDLLGKKADALKASGADISKNISVMRQNAYRLNRLVGNLLDITKLDAGFMEPKWESKNIVGWLESLVKSTELYARQKGLALTFRSDTPEFQMQTDGFMLDRILLNLLSNAIKHTPAGGRIDVRCRVWEGRVAVSVKDSGEGIPEEKRDIVFDRFRQVNTSLTRASEGCGIGLALTKSLVELLGGRIWLESRVGAGSEFSFELPVLSQAASASKPVDQSGMQLDRRVQIELSDIGVE